MESELLIINYHYVRETFPNSGIHGITPKYFQEQIDKIIVAGYKFISLEELVNYSETNLSLVESKKYCLLTFDDGLKESYENAYRFLQTRGVPAAFFICSDTLNRDKLLQVHKLQHIRSVISEEELVTETNRIIPIVNQKTLLFNAIQQYPWDSEISAILKYTINFELNWDRSQEFVNDLFIKYFKDETKLAEELYLSPEQLEELANAKSIGSHTISHRALSRLSDQDLRHELLNSKAIIEKFLASKIQSVSYPYGENSSVNDLVFSYAKMAKYKLGFTMNRSVNKLHTIHQDRLKLSRYDTNDVLGGKTANLFKNVVK
jgi:peptidoglycan/xylan/chitin deacetylase (PgdA/CDA1 family)